MSWLLPAAVIAAIPLALIFGYGVLGPMGDGYRPFTSPKTAAEDRAYGNHPERRLKKWHL